MITAAENELQQSSIETTELEYLLLFMEDDEGHIGRFLLTIREQLQVDKNEYIEKLKDIFIGHP